jgi:GT2 family glycosyltransferase
LRGQTRPPEQVIVVDNGSVDDSLDLLTHYREVDVIRLSTNTGFAGGANTGIRACTGDYIALLNNDVQAEEQWLAVLVDRMNAAPATVGYLAPKILDESGLFLDSAGDYLDRSGIPQQLGHGCPDDGSWDEPRAITSACAAASLYRRELFDDVGLLDERFFAYLEDVDLCLRGVLRGWQGEFVPAARVRHESGATSGKVSGFKRYHSIRNAYFLVTKNVPGRVLPVIAPWFFMSQLAWLISAALHGELRAAIRGHRHGVGAVLRLLPDRRRILGGATCTPAEFRRHLQPTQFRRRGREAIARRRAGRRAHVTAAP